MQRTNQWLDNQALLEVEAAFENPPLWTFLVLGGKKCQHCGKYGLGEAGGRRWWCIRGGDRCAKQHAVNTGCVLI